MGQNAMCSSKACKPCGPVDAAVDTVEVDLSKIRVRSAPEAEATTERIPALSARRLLSEEPAIWQEESPNGSDRDVDDIKNPSSIAAGDIRATAPTGLPGREQSDGDELRPLPKSLQAITCRGQSAGDLPTELKDTPSMASSEAATDMSSENPPVDERVREFLAAHGFRKVTSYRRRAPRVGRPLHAAVMQRDARIRGCCGHLTAPGSGTGRHGATAPKMWRRPFKEEFARADRRAAGTTQEQAWFLRRGSCCSS